MSRLALLLVPVLAVVLTLPLAAGPAIAGPEGGSPRDLDELSRELDALAERLSELATLAARDARWRVVEAYLGKTDEEFRKRKGTKAEDVFKIMVDAEAPEKLRLAAQQALLDVRVMTLDPYLVDRKGASRSRSVFAKQRLKLLSDKDPRTRELVQELFLGFFPGAKRDTDIRAFNAKGATRAESKRVKSAWNAFFRKR